MYMENEDVQDNLKKSYKLYFAYKTWNAFT